MFKTIYETLKRKGLIFKVNRKVDFIDYFIKEYTINDLEDIAKDKEYDEVFWYIRDKINNMPYKEAKDLIWGYGFYDCNDLDRFFGHSPEWNDDNDEFGIYGLTMELVEDLIDIYEILNENEED